MAASSSISGVDIHVQIEVLEKRVSQLESDVVFLKKMVELKNVENHHLHLQESVGTPIIGDFPSNTKTEQDADAETEDCCLQTSKGKEKVRGFPLVTNIHDADSEISPFHPPTAMGTAIMGEFPVITSKEQDAEKQVVAKTSEFYLRASKRKDFDGGLLSAAAEDLMGLDFTQAPVISKVQNTFHRSQENTHCLLDSPNPEIIYESPVPVKASYPHNSLDSPSLETELPQAAKARLNSSMHPDSPAFDPVSTEPKVFKSVWKGSLDSSIHAVPSSQVSHHGGIQNSENRFQKFDGGISSLILQGIVPAQCSIVNPEIVKHRQETPGHGQSKGGQDQSSLLQVADSTSERGSLVQVPSVLRVESSTVAGAAPPLVSHRTISTQFPLVQSTEDSRAIPEDSVKVAVPVVNKEQLEVAQITNHLSALSLHTPLETVMASNHQDPPSASKHDLSTLKNPTEAVYEQLLTASKAIDERSEARREAAKKEALKTVEVPSLQTPLGTTTASKHQDPPPATKYDLSTLNKPTETVFEQLLAASKAFDERSDARREAAKKGPLKKVTPIEEVSDAFEHVDLLQLRKPTFTRDLGSVLDPESRRMVLRPSARLPTPPTQFPTAGRPLHLTFKRVIAKLLLPDGATRTMGHLDRPTYPHAELSMRLYISENETTSVTLVARIFSTGNDFLVLDTASTRPMPEFNIKFQLPGVLNTDSITANTVPIAEQTEFAPSSPIQAEIQNLRDPLTKQLVGNLRHISFAFTKQDYNLPEVEEISHQVDTVEHSQWDLDAVAFFEFISAFSGEEKKVLTMLFTDEHSTETVDEMMMVISKNCNLQSSLWHDHGVTWRVSEDAKGSKKWLLTSHTSPRPQW